MPTQFNTASTEPPLIVDLDETLVRTDTLHESLLMLFKRRPVLAIRCLVCALRGRAYFKKQIAAHISLPVEHLPFNSLVLSFLNQERAANRNIQLVTAAHVSIATSIANHLGFFNEVHGTDEANLKGTKKRDFLVTQFGEGGFDYIGDSRSDIPVFVSARRALLVSTSLRRQRQVAEKVALHKIFSDKQLSSYQLSQTINAFAWVRNFIAFATIFLCFHLQGLPTSLDQNIIAGFVLFCLIDSATSLVNQLRRLEEDRKDPARRELPFASGSLRIKDGVFIVALLLALGTLLLLAIPTKLLPLYGIYSFLCLLSSEYPRYKMQVEPDHLSTK